MIVLDSNVLSALMRADSVVVAWLDGQPAESVWTTAVTVFEVRFGLEILKPGRRRTHLEEAFRRIVDDALEERVLAFDQEAAKEAAALAAKRRAAGRPIEFRDAEIAGIVAARRAALATGNIRHFEELGITVIDPWERH